MAQQSNSFWQPKIHMAWFVQSLDISIPCFGSNENNNAHGDTNVHNRDHISLINDIETDSAQQNK